MTLALGINTKSVLTDSFIAGADLSGNQFYGVELTANRTVDLVNAVTDKPIGILMNAPASGREAEVMIVGKARIIATEAISAGNLIRIHSDGKAAAFDPGTDTTAYGIGICTLGCSNANEYIEAVISCTSMMRGV